MTKVFMALKWEHFMSLWLLLLCNSGTLNRLRCCVCVFVCTFMCMCEHRCVSTVALCVAVSGKAAGPQLLPCLREGAWFYSDGYVRLAGTYASAYSHLSASHLSVGVLALRTCIYPNQGFVEFLGSQTQVITRVKHVLFSLSHLTSPHCEKELTHSP